MENTSILISDSPLSYAWLIDQGSYSENFAKKLLNFEKIQRLQINTVLDICCGTGNLLNIMQENGKTCYGTENINDFYLYDLMHYQDFNLHNTKNVNEIGIAKKFDLITMTNGVLNNIDSLEKIESFFADVYKHLNNGGIFFFDFNTKKYYDNLAENSLVERDEFDKYTTISRENNSNINISTTFYLKTSVEDTEKYKKVENNEKNYIFSSVDISKLIKTTGFRYLISTDENLSPILNFDNQKKGYIIAIKREK